MTVEALVAVCVFLTANTGALIFFAGRVTERLRAHDVEFKNTNARVGVVERDNRDLAIEVSALKGEMRA